MTYPTQRTHANVVLAAFYPSALVKPIGGDSVGQLLVNSDAAHFPEPSMVPASQSTDKVCGEAPRLATEKESAESDASVRFSLGFVGSTLRSEELLSQGTKSPRSIIGATSHVRTIREIRSDQASKVRELFDKRNGSATLCLYIIKHEV